MPSTATITAFYEFSANTKARASLVNANFSLFRGHLLPLNTSTATAANNTFDLGSYEYHWNKGYITTLELGSTSTASTTISMDTTTITGEMVFKLGGVEKVRINTNGIYKAPITSATTVASAGQIANSSLINVSFATVTATTITASKLTISSNGRPISIMLIGATSTGFNDIHVQGYGGVQYAYLTLLRNGLTIMTSRIGNEQTATAYSAIPSSSFQFLDFAASGTYVYELSSRVENAFQSFGIIESKLIAYEI